MLYHSKTIANLFEEKILAVFSQRLRKESIETSFGADLNGQIHVFTMVFSVLRTGSQKYVSTETAVE